MTNENSYSTPAHSYCRIFAKEIKVLERLLKTYTSFGDDLQEDSRKLLFEMSQEADEDFEHYSPSVIDYINLCSMEMTVLGQRSNGESDWTVIGLRLVKSDIGPIVAIEWLDSDFIEVKVHWAGGSAVQCVAAPNVVLAFAKLIDG